MPIATEIGMLRLLPGVDPTDVKSEGAQRLKKVYETLGQQKGFIRGYWVSKEVLFILASRKEA